MKKEEEKEVVMTEEEKKAYIAEHTKLMTEAFEKADKTNNKLDTLKYEIASFENDNKDNEILKEYIKLLNQKEKYEKYLNDVKAQLYENMMIVDIDALNGKTLDANLTRPYIKREILLADFIKDNPEGSKLYNKYVRDKQIKGNVKLKNLLLESKK